MNILKQLTNYLIISRNIIYIIKELSEMFSFLASERNHSPIPKHVANNFGSFTELFRTSYYIVYSAKSKENPEKLYSVRALNINEEFVKDNYDIAATMFIQETLYMCLRGGRLEPLIIANFEINDKKIAFVMESYNQTKFDDHIDLEKFHDEISIDIGFLAKHMKFTKLCLDTTETIYKFKMDESHESYILSDWLKVKPPVDTRATTYSEKDPDAVVGESVYELGKLVVSLAGVSQKKIDDLQTVQDEEFHSVLVTKIIDGLKTTDYKWKDLDSFCEKMKTSLSKEPQHLRAKEKSFSSPSFSYNGMNSTNPKNLGSEYSASIGEPDSPQVVHRASLTEKESNNQLNDLFSHRYVFVVSLLTQNLKLKLALWYADEESRIKLMNLAKGTPESGSYKGAQVHESVIAVFNRESRVQQIPQTNYLLSYQYNQQAFSVKIDDISPKNSGTIFNLTSDKGCIL